MATYTSGTVWKVANFSSYTVADFQELKWEFEAPNSYNPDTGKVSAAGRWEGNYTKVTDDSIDVTISGRDGDDAFKVTFPSAQFFVVTKNGQPYRLGIRM